MRLRELPFLFSLLQCQWKEPKALRKLQDRKLRQLVRHAYDQVPYYRCLFDSVGVTPEDINGVGDLPRLPLTSRQELIGQNSEALLARNCIRQPCHKTETSGSTGIPLTILHRRQDLTKMNFVWARAYFAHGFKLWHRTASLSGRRHDPRHKPWYEHLGLMRRRTLNAWDDPEQWIAALNRWKPQALTGYVMTLKLLAEAMQAQDVGNSDLRLVFQCSGLLDSGSRRFLSSVLRARIVDIYGSAEGGCLAWECGTCSGYHVNSDMVIVELLDNGQAVSPGQAGEVVITNLHSYAMPFIRYRQSDVGVWAEGAARCGRGLPLLRAIEGRLADFITLPSGQKISPHPFFVALDTVAGVAKWRLVQETSRRLRVELIVGQHSAGRACQEAKANLAAIIGDQMEIIVSEVDVLPNDPSQKFRSITSAVP